MTSALVVRALVGLYAALVIATLVLRYLSALDERFASDVVLLAVFSASHLVGALIALRRPRNPVGWLLATSALLVVLAFFADLYARYGVVTAPGSLPGARTMYWLSNWPWIGMFGGVLFAALFFPDGRLPSRRWLPFAWAAAAFFSFTTVVFAFAPVVDPPHPELVNPFGVEALRGVAEFLESTIGFGIFLILLSGTILSLAARFRRSRGAERQQLKWVASAVAVAVAGFVIADAMPDGILADLALGAAHLALPLAIAVAMLRYRLYDIDVLINRTLVYGAVSAALVVTYFGGVILLQPLLRPLTSGSELAIAGSTLLVVAIFQPLRRLVQDAIDRRFYRAKYDAGRAVDRFSARLRDQVDLDSLSGELLAIVDDTVKPAHASLWIREGRS